MIPAVIRRLILAGVTQSDQGMTLMMEGKPLPGARSTHRHPFPVRSSIDADRAYALVERFWKLNRSAVNPDTDILANALSQELGAKTVEAESGSRCLTWTIPDHWHVRKGQLRRLDGAVLADYADNPLHLWTHSIGFSGEIDRETLLRNHVQTDPARPDEFLYHYRNGYKKDIRTWGFSLPYRLVETLTEDRYFVEIDADLDNNGTLKVVDAFVEGEFSDTIFFMAHTCHPALVSDGLACIATAAEVYHALKAGPKPRYSYRFLFAPEYFGAAAYLENGSQEDIANLKFGIYLDMVTTFEPLGFQRSLQGVSRLDKIARNILASHTSVLVEKRYRQLWGNDETFYNGRGFEIPTIGIGRLMHREYHYDTDDLDRLSMYHLEESAWILQRIVEVFETDYVPDPQFLGPIFLSGHGLETYAPAVNNWPAVVERVQALTNGERSCFEIADMLNVDYFAIRDFCDLLLDKNLIGKKNRAPQSCDHGAFSPLGMSLE